MLESNTEMLFYFLLMVGIILIIYVLIRLIRLEHRLLSLGEHLEKLANAVQKRKK